jgi:hypothetical protein
LPFGIIKVEYRTSCYAPLPSAVTQGFPNGMWK